MGTEWKLDSQLRASLERIEEIVKKMQHPETGVAVTTVKALWHTIPNVCTGSDIVSWLFTNLELKSRPEALNLARTIAKYGYIFVALDSKLTVKDDLTHHRFQDKHFWPTKERSISNTDYAIHLCKRLFSNKNRSNLEVYEMDQFTRLQRHLGHAWEYIWLQAEASYKVDKKKCKSEQYIIESQERAFWNLHKPPPYSDYVLAADPLKFKKEVPESDSSISSERPSSAPSTLRRKPESEFISDSTDLLAFKKRNDPKAIDGLISYCSQFSVFDPLMRQAADNQAHNFYADDTASTDSGGSNKKLSIASQTDRWSIGLEELLRDREGVLVFLKHLEKEHSSENLRFWIACEDYKGYPLKKLREKAETIYNDFFKRSAFYQINLESKTMSEVKESMENPDHYTFHAAQQEIFRLMRSDSYPRFLKSENFKQIVKESEQITPQKGQEKKGGILSILTSPQHKVQ